MWHLHFCNGRTRASGDLVLYFFSKASFPSSSPRASMIRWSPFFPPHIHHLAFIGFCLLEG